MESILFSLSKLNKDMNIQVKTKWLFLLLLLTQLCFGQNKKTLDIGILIDTKVEELLPYLDHLKTQVQAVVGEDANIQFNEANVLSNEFSLEQAKKNYNQFLNNEVDVILSFGVFSNLMIAQKEEFLKPTFMLGASIQDLNGLNVSLKTSGIPNFSYLIDSKSYLNDLDDFKKLVNYNKVGFVLEAAYYNQEIIRNNLSKLLNQAEVKIIPYNSISDIKANLDGVDAVYLAGGLFMSQAEVTELGQWFQDHNLPSFTSNGIEQVKQGFMVTNQTDDNFEQVSRRIALSIEAYVNGTPLEDLPVFLDLSSRLTINYNIADKLGVPIKYSQLDKTDFVGSLYELDKESQLSLLDVIDLVLKENLSLKAAEKSVELSEQSVKTAKSNYLPSLSVSGTGTYLDPKIAEISNGQNPEYTVAGNVVLQQTLFSEGANANIAIQKHLKEAEKQNLNANQLDAVFNVTNAYFNILILKSNVNIKLRNLKLTRQNLLLAQQNYDAGLKGKSDMLRFRSEMAQNTQAMIEAANQLEQGYMQLNMLLNNPIDAKIEVEDVILNKGLFKQYNYSRFYELLDDPSRRDLFIDFLVQEAITNAPELKSLYYNLQATERNIQLSGSGRFLPTVALQGQYNNTFKRGGVGSTFPTGFPAAPDDNYNIALNVSLPIFNQNTNSINKQTAIIQKEQIEFNQGNLKQSIATNIRTSVLNIINEISNIELSKTSENSAKEAYELTKTSYSNGAVNIVQLIDVQNNYLNAQLANTNAIYNYLIQALQLERNLGAYFLLKSPEENANFSERFKQYLEQHQ